MLNFSFYKAITGMVIALIVLGCSNEINQSENPVNIIFDTDMTTDCDDAGALAMLHTLERKGEANILATVVNNMGEYSSGATAAINAFYNRPDIPVGAYQGDIVGRDAADFFADIAKDKDSYGHSASSRNQFPDAVEVYRKVLAEAGQNEVIIVSVGHLNNLYDLLESGADQYSELNGVQLVEEKVDHLVVMGGHFLPDVSERYPYGREHNFRARGSAQFTGSVLEKWPTRVVISGYEIGENILTGPRLTALDENHPVRYAYEHHPSQPLINGRMSWDQTAILAAVRDPELYWDLSNQGWAEVDEEGHNSWTSDPDGLHVYLIERNNPGPSEIAEIIEELMVDMP
ncbi:MAG: nucleoside hydrolase [Balneolaceae bacterium]|nr:nucleoside hydrolase [Balneolaceae bacterium]